MFNVYTGQQIRVLWNGIYSSSCLVRNGVKQGAVISPILFCIYFDSLLLTLHDADIGCIIGNWFIVALSYMQMM